MGDEAASAVLRPVLWSVVGGKDAGGVVVRESQDFNSPKEPRRLGTGSIVKQLELDGDRLQYELLKGVGPPSGWVSVVLRTQVDNLEHTKIVKDLLLRLPPTGSSESLASSAQEETQMDLKRGDRVKIRGLVKARDLNGRRGVLESFDEDTGRWHVAVLHGQHKIMVKALRADNLEFEDWWLGPSVSKPHVFGGSAHPAKPESSHQVTAQADLGVESIRSDQEAGVLGTASESGNPEDDDEIEFGILQQPLGLCMKCEECRGWTRRCVSKLSDAIQPLPEPHRSVGSKAGLGLRVERGETLPSLTDEMPTSFNGEDFVWSGKQGAFWEPKVGRGVASGANGVETCADCGCAESAHEDVSRRLGRFATRGVPKVALNWSQVELALWGDTEGLFRPRSRDTPGRQATPATASRASASCTGSIGAGLPLVSVISPTTGTRRCFHNLLWLCFSVQKYEARELVVVDTGEDGPSAFFLGKMREDPRVVYIYYRVPERRWSVGLKRNLACYFASGDVIAHFDDDDVYASCYLDIMVGYLRDPCETFATYRVSTNNQKPIPEELLRCLGASNEDEVRSRQSECLVKCSHVLGTFSAACAKLSSWHTFGLRSCGWSHFDALKMALGSECALYGWGFSMVYLKTAWIVCPFLHTRLGEDLDFVRSLRRLDFPVALAPDTKGICAHTHHADNTAGGADDCGGRGKGTMMMYSPLHPMVFHMERTAKELYAAQELKLAKDGIKARAL